MPGFIWHKSTCFSRKLSCLFIIINLQNYFGDAWNVFDFIIVLGSFIDIVYSEVHVSIRKSREL